MFFGGSFLNLEKWLRAHCSLLRLITEAQWSCTVSSKWTGIYISWLTPTARAAVEGPGVMLSWHGPSPAHPNTSYAIIKGPHPPVPPSAVSDVTWPTVRRELGAASLANYARVTLPGLGSDGLVTSAAFSAAHHYRDTSSSNIWPNIFLHSRCN